LFSFLQNSTHFYDKNLVQQILIIKIICTALTVFKLDSKLAAYSYFSSNLHTSSFKNILPSLTTFSCNLRPYFWAGASLWSTKTNKKFRYFFNWNKARVMPTLSRDDKLVTIMTIPVSKQPRKSFTDATTVHVDSIVSSSSDGTCFTAVCQLFPSFNSISAPGHL